METYALAVLIIVVALIFDFLNGFHDAANAIATVVVTKTLTPLQAVLMAGMANFVGYFVFGVSVATTVGKGIIDVGYVTIPLILAGLMGAIIWNIMTWFLGLPTSSSHALIGGLVGAGIAAAGFKAIIAAGLIKVVLFIVVAPLLGLLGAMLFTIMVSWLFFRSNYPKSNRLFKYLQLISSFSYSVGHGTNDAQKTMGVIALVLFSAGISPVFKVENWIILTCHAAIALGTMFGGWRIVKTMGTNITKVRAKEGFIAETSSALVLVGTAHFGIPVSTTHVIAGSIMGVGTIEHAKSVRWMTARKIVWAWLITIPVTAIFSFLSYFAVISFV